MTAQYQLEYNGLVMGLGTAYSVVKVDGLEDLDVRNGDSTLPRAAGNVPGLHVAAAKEIIVEVVAKGVKGSQEQRDAVQAIHDAFGIQDAPVPFYFHEPGMTERRYMFARPLGRTSPRDPRYPFFSKVVVRLTAADPTVYGDTQSVSSIPLFSSSSGGENLPVVQLPMNFGADASAGNVIHNAGNAKAYPLLRFHGPVVGTCTSVTVLNVTTGVTARFDTTMLTGQKLTADMRRIVTADTSSAESYVSLDGANKYGDWQLPRTPLYLAPGDNELRFTISGGTSTDVQCTLVVSDSW